jgi:hypothetical protein
LSIPDSSVRSELHAPGSIMKLRIETMSAIVSHDAIARPTPSRT